MIIVFVLCQLSGVYEGAVSMETEQWCVNQLQRRAEPAAGAHSDATPLIKIDRSFLWVMLRCAKALHVLFTSTSLSSLRFNVRMMRSS